MMTVMATGLLQARKRVDMPNAFEEYLKEHSDELLASLKQVVNRATTHRETGESG